MIGLGTIINVVAIVVGGFLGQLFGKKLSKRLQQTLMLAMGVCVMMLGIGGIVQEMFTVEDGRLVMQGSLLVIGCMALGGFVGELLNIDGKLEHFGVWLRKISKNEGDNSFLDSFLTATFAVCIGAMAIVGPLQDGLTGDYSTLVAKSILDCVIIMIMSASCGKGAAFSAVPVLIIQGSVTALSRLIAPILTDAALANLSYVGSLLIFCVGLNLVFDRKIRVANMLPALLFAVGFSYLA